MVVDLASNQGLCGVMDDKDHQQLISRLFALLTMKFEDGAADAVNGQGHCKDPQAIQKLADSLQALAEEITIITEAITALTRSGS